MAHTIVLEVNLLHKEVCSGCPCNQDRCTLYYWDKKEYVRYNTQTDDIQDPTVQPLGRTFPIDRGWGYSTKRPQKCIDELG